MNEKVREIRELILRAKELAGGLHPQCLPTQMVSINLLNALYELSSVAGADPLIREREAAEDAVKTAEYERAIETMDAHFQAGQEPENGLAEVSAFDGQEVVPVQEGPNRCGDPECCSECQAKTEQQKTVDSADEPTNEPQEPNDCGDSQDLHYTDADSGHIVMG